MGERSCDPGSRGSARRSFRVVVVLVAVAVCWAASSAYAAAVTFSVPPGTADSMSGTCTPPSGGQSSCANLRAAVGRADVAANAGSTIELAAGAYTLDSHGGPSSLNLSEPMTLSGAGPGQTVITQNAANAGVISVNAPSNSFVLISGVEVTGGNLLGTAGGAGLGGGGAFGGGVSASSPLALTHALLTGNSATGGVGGPSTNSPGGGGGNAFGAGIYATSTLEILDSTIEVNHATGGAGGPKAGTGAAGGGGPASGAGVAALGTLVVEASTIANNIAVGGAGGGVGAAGGSASGGGGFVNNGGTLVNTTVFDNSALGGTAGSGGTTGAAVGGGFELDTNGSTRLASDTFDANQASGGVILGGNLFTNSRPVTSSDTIVAAGIGAPASNNCRGGPFIDAGHNLEDDATAQCGFSSASDILAGTPPGLAASLAGNGGPTQTLALLPGSPAIVNGGLCTDPTQAANTLLATDQRELPRPNPCAVGAFQPENPVSTLAPALSGTPAVGQTLSCSHGTWTGDGTLTFAYQWLRNGGSVAGATSPTFAVTAADARNALACQVSATNLYGSARATTAAVSVPPVILPPAPSVTRASQSQKKWRLGSKLPHVSRAPKAPIGTTFKFNLNERATVRFDFRTSVSGRRVTTSTSAHKVTSKCVPQTKRNKHNGNCRRTVTAGTLSFVGHAGTNTVRFQGRLSRIKALKPGRYTLVITATTASGKSSPHSLVFTIVS